MHTSMTLLIALAMVLVAGLLALGIAGPEGTRALLHGASEVIRLW